MSLTTSLPNGTNGMAIGPDGSLYVVNTGHQTVLRFNPASGALIGTFVPAGSGLSFPEGMTLGPDNNLYVADWDTASGSSTGPREPPWQPSRPAVPEPVCLRTT